jgi:hypothetical protein
LELLEAVPPGLGTTGSSTLPLSPLSRADYPQVKFWTRDEWDDHKSRSKDASGPKGKGLERSSNVTARSPRPGTRTSFLIAGLPVPSS